MPTLGTASKPGAYIHAYGGSSQMNQEAEILTAPARIRITDLGQWVAGWSSTARVRICVWNGTTEALLGQSAQFTAANGGSAGTGDVDLYTEPLITPVELDAGATFYVGFVRHPDDACLIASGASGSAPHYEGRSGATWPNTLGAAAGPTSTARRIGAYVANYDLISGGKVYRSGAWVDSDAVKIYRSGAWVDADAVKIYRSGAWVDAE